MKPRTTAAHYFPPLIENGVLPRYDRMRNLRAWLKRADPVDVLAAGLIVGAAVGLAVALYLIRR